MRNFAFLTIALSFSVCFTLNVQAREFLSSTYQTLEVKAQNSCSNSKLSQVISIDNKVITTLCLNDHIKCLVEGSCIVIEGDSKKVIAFSRIDQETQLSRWVELNQKRCQYGLGVQNICLDPFYTISADLTQYKLGDVLFVKRLKGLLLPSGEKHSGYLIVRDSAKILTGTGADRLHIFTGLRSQGFDHELLESFDIYGNTKSFEYQKADEKIAAQVRAERNYPALPGVSLSEEVIK